MRLRWGIAALVCIGAAIWMLVLLSTARRARSVVHAKTQV